MTWTYSQRTGELKHNHIIVTRGYSGKGAGRNNPQMENIHDVGPIPRGQYQIGRARNAGKQGPHVMDLTPVNHNAQGRTELLIHGDSKKAPGTASTGCIILSKDIRNQISNSSDNELIVTE